MVLHSTQTFSVFWCFW